MNGTHRIAMGVFMVAVFMVASLVPMISEPDSEASVTSKTVYTWDYKTTEYIFHDWLDNEVAAIRFSVTNNGTADASLTLEGKITDVNTDYYALYLKRTVYYENGSVMNTSTQSSRFLGSTYEDWESNQICDFGTANRKAVFEAYIVDYSEWKANKGDLGDYYDSSHYPDKYTITINQTVSTTNSYYTAIRMDVGEGTLPSGTPSVISKTETGDSITSTSLTFPSSVPTRDGYEFVGWSKTSGSSSIAYEAGKTYTVTAGEETTVYAVWRASTVQVVFMDGSTILESRTISKGTAVTSYPSTDREGYIFSGWYTDLSFSQRFDTSSTISEDTTLYGKWVEELRFESKPLAELNVVKVSGSESTFLFDASASTQYQVIVWDFGDGTSSVSKEPMVTHYYAQPGKYTVTMTMSNETYGDSVVTYELDVPAEGSYASGVSVGAIAGVVVVALLLLMIVRRTF